jgi:addiction module HigA family antidote
MTKPIAKKPSRGRAKMALRLRRLFGTTPEFWLNLQRKVDLWDAARELKREIAHIHPLATP